MSFYSKFAIFYEEIFPFSQVVADFLTKRCPSVGSCLDIGCGTGNYAGYLSTQGLSVTGIDLDTSMISYATQHYPDVTFHCMDMRDIKALDTQFNFIYCIGNSGAHLPREDIDIFLSNIRSILVPGGTWILQLMNWNYVLTQKCVVFPKVMTESNLIFNRTYTQISPECVQFETSLVRGNECIFEDSVQLYPIPSEDIINLHSKSGFILNEHLGSYNGIEFNAGVFSASIYVFTAPAKH